MDSAPAAKTKSEIASAEDSGSYNFHRKSLPWNGDTNRKVGRPPLSMYIVLESILFVLTEGCSWRAIDRPQGPLEFGVPVFSSLVSTRRLN